MTPADEDTLAAGAGALAVLFGVTFVILIGWAVMALLTV